MPTITDPNIVEALLNNDGVYEVDGECDPQIYALYEYATIEDEIVWCVLYDELEVKEFLTSPFVRCPRLLWNVHAGKVGEPTKGERT